MIGERSLHELVRTVSVSYAVPYVAALLVVCGLICFGLAIVAGDLRWLFACVGTSAIGGGVVTILYAVFAQPKLLRSERYVAEQRLLDIVTDSDQDADARAVAGRILVTARAEAEVPKLRTDQS